ncbi:MAG TPA: ribonuclease D, partial [Flavobacteriales bacterium]|nr:ribonuclease D [Flavobacteriales bacterium]
MVNYELITTAPALQACAELLSKEVMIALDTEASSFHRYRESVCLIQISTRTHTYLIDPLSIPDLAPLRVLLAQKGMEVVIHDADYDLRILAKHHQIRVENVFDTLVAADEGQGGDAAADLGVAADVGGRVLRGRGLLADADGDHVAHQAPLPKDMLDYAAGDTSHLIALRDILEAKLKAVGRWGWAEEEFSLLTDAPFNLPVNDEPAFLRLKGAKMLKPHQLAILREVHGWRESVAEQQDRAAFMILGNDVLLS